MIPSSLELLNETHWALDNIILISCHYSIGTPTQTQYNDIQLVLADKSNGCMENEKKFVSFFSD